MTDSIVIGGKKAKYFPVRKYRVEVNCWAKVDTAKSHILRLDPAARFENETGRVFRVETTRALDLEALLDATVDRIE